VEVFCWEVSTLRMALLEVAKVRFYELSAGSRSRKMHKPFKLEQIFSDQLAVTSYGRAVFCDDENVATRIYTRQRMAVKLLQIV
jgi:hypothetical protein